MHTLTQSEVGAFCINQSLLQHSQYTCGAELSQYSHHCPLIGITGCKEWYHESCENIGPQAVFKDDSNDWKCKVCIAGEKQSA